MIDAGPRNHLYLRSTPLSGGVFRLRRNRKDSSKIALNVDLHLALNRRQHDLIYQRANGVRCLYPLALFFIRKREFLCAF